MSNRVIAVGMSGGVDSSVAAALLQEQGEQIIGIMLRLWSAGPETENRCCTPRDVANARAVAAQLGIPFHVLDAREVFKQYVVDSFVNGYAHGITPNPCLQCNRFVRWGFLLEQAQAIGATHLATGHYARLQSHADRRQLLRACDRSKDQSYVLSVLTQQQLSCTILPLGDWTKQEVRRYARSRGFPSAQREESQDLCFLGGMDYRDFLRSQRPHSLEPGPIENLAGEVLGTHHGLAAYTIGQRRGLGIAHAEPLYVIEKDLPRNTLLVGARSQLGRKQFQIGDTHWIAGEPPDPGDPLLVRVRYKASEVGARLMPLNGDQVEVLLDQALPDITPGQRAVFYQNEICLGGGTILP